MRGAPPTATASPSPKTSSRGILPRTILSDKLSGLIDEFERAEKGRFFIWGHSFELDFDDGWNRAEAVLKRLKNIDAEI